MITTMIYDDYNHEPLPNSLVIQVYLVSDYCILMAHGAITEMVRLEPGCSLLHSQWEDGAPASSSTRLLLRTDIGLSRMGA